MKQIFVLSLLLISTGVYAGTVTLLDDSIIEGELLSQSETNIVLQAVIGDVYISRNDILSTEGFTLMTITNTSTNYALIYNLLFEEAKKKLTSETFITIESLSVRLNLEQKTELYSTYKKNYYLGFSGYSRNQGNTLGFYGSIISGSSTSVALIAAFISALNNLFTSNKVEWAAPVIGTLTLSTIYFTFFQPIFYQSRYNKGLRQALDLDREYTMNRYYMDPLITPNLKDDQLVSIAVLNLRF